MRRWLADWDARGVTDFSLAALAARPGARAGVCAGASYGARLVRSFAQLVMQAMSVAVSVPSDGILLPAAAGERGGEHLVQQQARRGL